MSPARKNVDVSTYSGRFAARLRMLREKAGLSVDDVVERLIAAGYEARQTTYYGWESGRSDAPLDAFPFLALSLNVKTPRALLPAE